MYYIICTNFQQSQLSTVTPIFGFNSQSELYSHCHTDTERIINMDLGIKIKLQLLFLENFIIFTHT